MTFTGDGLIQKVLDLLGVTITTSDGYYLAYISSLIIALAIIVIMFVGIFKFLVYLRKG